ncbi:unnamed protein product [Prunus armeniaca]
MSMETKLKVKEEIERLLKAGFIRPAIYADWLANIVLVLKRKTGAVRICIDYRNLNEASPKDEYPMPMADMLVDGAAHNQMLSFMDGNAGYNQIMVAEEDIHKTAFMCPGHIALYFTAVKLRHYMLPFTIYIIAKTYLIKYMLTRPMLRGIIGKWTLALTEFAFRYVPQKAVKGQVVADFLADHPGEEIENMNSLDIANADMLTRAHTCLTNPIYSVHLTPWKLYFDG